MFSSEKFSNPVFPPSKVFGLYRWTTTRLAPFAAFIRRAKSKDPSPSLRTFSAAPRSYRGSTAPRRELWLPDCYAVKRGLVCVTGVQLSLYGKSIIPAVCILLMANCQKHSVTPFPSFSPQTTKAADNSTPPSATQPSLPQGDSTQANPNPKSTSKAGSKPPAIAPKSSPESAAAFFSQVQPQLPAGSLDVKVPIKSAAGGWGTINLATAIRDVLDSFTPSGFILECPTRMRVGSVESVRLTTRQNLNDLLRQKLQDLGVRAEYLSGIISLAAADLTSPTGGSFSIQPERPPASDMWIWRVEARQPGNQTLQVKVTLSARIPSHGEVDANAATLSRTVAVDADPFFPYGDFIGRHWLEMAGSLAGLMGAWLIWLLWRTRRTPFKASLH
jgi:hypothetical protein